MTSSAVKRFVSGGLALLTGRPEVPCQRFRICDLPTANGRTFRGAFEMKRPEDLPRNIALREGLTEEAAALKIGAPSLDHLHYLGISSKGISMDRWNKVRGSITYDPTREGFVVNDDNIDRRSFQRVKRNGVILRPEIRPEDHTHEKSFSTERAIDPIRIVAGRLGAEPDVFKPFNICDAFIEGHTLDGKGMQTFEVGQGFGYECGMLLASYIKRLGITDPVQVGTAIARAAEYKSRMVSTESYIHGALSCMYPDFPGTDRPDLMLALERAVVVRVPQIFYLDVQSGLIKGVLKRLGADKATYTVDDAKDNMWLHYDDQVRLSDAERVFIGLMKKSGESRALKLLINRYKSYTNVALGQDDIVRLVAGRIESLGQNIDMMYAFAAAAGIEAEKLIRRLLVTEVDLMDRV